jgi:two-component sensor histidine kinase
MARAIRGRLSALTRAHELARPGLIDPTGKLFYEASLRSLIAAIFEPYVDDQSEVPARFIFVGPDLNISDQAVTNVALVLHELATNAAKYGALSTEGGVVQISSCLEGENLRLTWTEEGGPKVVKRPEEEGFGSVLTRQVIVNQFQGKLEREWHAGGLVMQMEIPIPNLIPQSTTRGDIYPHR